MTKILIVHSQPFLPMSKGSDKVIYEYCELLKNKGCELHYCYFGDEHPTKEFIDFFGAKVYHYKKRLRDKYSTANICRKIRLKLANKYKVDDYYPIGIENLINKLNIEFGFDYCIVNYITLTRLFEKVDIQRKVLYSHDAFTNKKEWLKVQNFWFSLSPNEEAKGIRRCTDIISIQKNESILFRYYNPNAQVYTVYSPFRFTKQRICNNKNILFIAGGNQLNYNGIVWCIEKILPLVLETEHSARLIIGGNICQMIEKYASDNIILHGFVNNLVDFYAMGDIVINPIYQGTGLKVKTFEALSFGKIVIAHRHSADGIFQEESAPLYLADNNIEFAGLLIRALKLEDRQTKSDESLKYIQRLNRYVSSEYDKLLEDFNT